MPPEPTNPTDLAAARERARLAMGGVERATKEAEKSKVTDERRQAAALAMEGSERRQRREAKEHELKEKQDMLKRIDEEVKRREAEVEKKRQEAEAAKKNQVAMREQEIKQKEDAFTASRSVIEKLKEERGSTLHAIHTLQSDLAEAVQAENISTEKIIIAEQEKVPSGNAYVLPENSGLSYRRLTIYLLIIIIALGGGTGYWYFKQKQATPVVVPVTVASIIFAEKNLEVNSSKIVRGEAVGKISAFLTSGTSQNEEIGNIYFTKEIANANALTQKDVLIFPEWQKYTESTIPEDFSRFVSQYMVGAYLYGSSSSLFLVLKIDPFDNVYRALLDNENGWVRQIFQSLGSSDITAVTAKQAFEYRVLKNLDTRVLRGADGKTALVYTFLDRQTLVVAQSDEALYHIYQVYNTPRSR